jgi:hypothetical protein
VSRSAWIRKVWGSSGIPFRMVLNILFHDEVFS